MKLTQLLIEYNRAKTLNVFADKIAAKIIKDPSARSLSADDVMAQLEQSDPTPANKYVQWLIKTYVNSGDQLEDITSGAGDDLTVFDQLKNRKMLGDDSDIGKIKNVNQLSRVVAANSDKLDQSTKKERRDDRGQYTQIFSGEQVDIVQPNDMAAAQYFGRSTGWCTAAVGSNHYEHYAKQGDMYVILPKGARPYVDEKTGKQRIEKYQVQLGSKSCKDEHDDGFKFSKLLSLYPEIKAVFGKMDEYKNLDHFASNEDEKRSIRAAAEAAKNKEIDDMMASLWADHKAS